MELTGDSKHRPKSTPREPKLWRVPHSTLPVRNTLLTRSFKVVAAMKTGDLNGKVLWNDVSYTRLNWTSC